MRRMIGPRSLGGQLMLVAALSLILAQAINLALLVRGGRQEHLSTIAAGAATTINDVATRIAAGEPTPPWMLPRGPGAGRRGAAPILHERIRRGPRQIIIDVRPHFRPGMADWPEMAERVRALLGSESSVTEVRAGRITLPARAPDSDYRGLAARRGGGDRVAVAVAAQLADGRWVTVRARLANGGARIGSLLIGQTLILFGLLLIPLLFVAWRVSRPLARLANAASGARLGQHEPPVPESGPRDVRDLTRAFNAMRQRIWAMLQDKDRMLGAVGHDLRTPLTSLRIRVEEVEDAGLRDKMSATIEEMAMMLDDILALARAGQPREAPEPTDLAAMLAALVDDYQDMGRPVVLASSGAGPVEPLLRTVRAAALRRAMRNLIDNALCYGGSATVGLAELPDGSAGLTVEDDGPGLAEESIAAMIEPFARAETSRNRTTGGSGLGLAIANAIAVAEGGMLDIRNRDPHGLRAQIILPPQT